MKTNRARLIISIVCLVLALAIAGGAVYAWFVSHLTAKTNGFETQVTSGDVELTITLYHATSENGTDFKEGNEIILGSSDTAGKMDKYTPRTGNISGTTTAILIQLEVTYLSDGDYTISAHPQSKTALNADECTCADVAEADKPFHLFTEHNLLSNVVYFQQVTPKSSGADNKDFSLAEKSDEQKFVAFNDQTDYGNIEKDTVTLITENGVVAEKQVTYYFIFDYLPDNINNLYSYMLSQNGGGFDKATLNTTLDFNQDITLTIGK